MQKNDSSNSLNLVVLMGVVLCFVLSGFAALLYQTAWMRQFSLVFGTSELAIAAVLSAYMGGLAFGASLAARYINRVTRPVLFYGVLEAGIALSALAVPLMLKLASMLYVLFLGGQPEPVDASGLGQSFFYLVVAFIVLAIPTTFMGATLPLLTKYVVQSKDQIGARVGLLYATNTAGAIGGTVTAGFFLLPLLGLNGTVWVGVFINLLVFVLAAWIARLVGDHRKLDSESDAEGLSSFPESQAEDKEDSLGKWRLSILPIMLLSGANSFLYEVLWTRLLGHILGGSITAFSTMLASFLGGIAIGSAIASRFAKTREQASFLFFFMQLGIAFTSMLIYNLLPNVIPETTGLQGNVLLAIVILLPATLFIGATFPLAVRIFAFDENDAASSSAQVYSWNTIGAIIGATVAAFFLIPAFKYEGAVKVAVLVNISLALMTALFLIRGNRLIQSAGVIATIAVIVLYQPAMPESILRTSPVYTMRTGEIKYYEVGRSSTVTVIENEGYLNIRNNGLPEASASLKGAPPEVHNQKMLAVMPILARPDAENILIVGLGGGVAAEAVPSSVKSVDIVELETEVVEANASFGDERAINPLDDPRMNIIINDARSALTLTDKRYDAIVSQPSHPWTAGASHLYTKEYMELARDHLSEDGVYLQWMNTQFVDELLLKSLTATMLDVFTHVRLYSWNSESLFFLGSEQPLNVEEDIARTGRPLSDDVLWYLEHGVGSVEDVIVALIMDQENVENFSQGGRVITDNYNLMATNSASVIGTENALRRPKINEVLSPYIPLLQLGSWLRTEFPVPLNYVYISDRLENNFKRNMAIELADSLVQERNPQSLVMIGLGQEQQRDRQESQKNLMLALSADPDNQQARFALIQPWLESILNEVPVPEYVQEEFAKLEGTALATINGRFAANRQDMNTLTRLDAALASVLPSDLWYETSVKLRADWRIRVTSPEYQPRFFNEATRLIDSAIVFSQDPSLYFLRMKSTLGAGDYMSSLETARRMLIRVSRLTYKNEDGDVLVSDDFINLNLSYVEEVKGLLRELEGRAEIPEYKIDSLAAEVNSIEAELRSML